MQNDNHNLSPESPIDSLAKLSPEEVYAGTCNEVFAAIARHNEGIQNAHNKAFAELARQDIERDLKQQSTLCACGNPAWLPGGRCSQCAETAD